jgi:hypothetical protein
VKNRVRWALPVLLLAAGGLRAGPIVLGTNLVLNGDAEVGAGSTDGSVVAVPDWSAEGGTLFTAVQYAAVPGNFPALSDPGPADRGVNFFAGGPGASVAVGDQNLDLTSLSAQINAGQINFAISAWLGGFQDQNDYAAFGVEFFDGPTLLGSDSLEGPDSGPRGSQTGLLFESDSGTIPVGTTSVDFVLQMFREQGTYNDGYADDLSFVLTSAASTAPAPEPGSGFLILAGGAAVVMLKRKL